MTAESQRAYRNRKTKGSDMQTSDTFVDCEGSHQVGRDRYPNGEVQCSVCYDWHPGLDGTAELPSHKRRIEWEAGTLRRVVSEAVATVEAMTDEQITLAHNSGVLDRGYKRAGCKCPTCTR